MSLDPRDSRRRGRSKSPGRRDERSHSRVRVPSPPEEPRGYEYEERRERRGGDPAQIVTAEPRYGGGGGVRMPERDAYAVPGAFDDDEGKDRERERGYGGKEYERGKEYGYEGVKGYAYEKETKPVYRDEYGRETSPPKSGSLRYEEERYKGERGGRDAMQYEDEKHARGHGGSFSIATGHSRVEAGINIGHGHGHEKREKKSKYEDADLAYGSPPGPGTMQAYAEPKKWEYAQPDEKISYSKTGGYDARNASPPRGYGRDSRDPRDHRDSHSHSRDSRDPRDSRDSRDSRDPRDLRDPRDVRDSRDSRHHERHGSSTYASDSARSSKNHIVTVEPGSRRRDASPNPAAAGLAPRMHSLSVSTGHHGGASMSLANAPGSPLLEAYHGTYQSISPMPSPLLMASHSHSSDINYIEAISPLNSDDERRGGSKKSRRTARFHDPEEEATILAKALKGEKHAPDTRPLIDILPGLTHEQVLELRVEYKRIVKTGSDKKGVNIAKHIKLRLKGEDASLMKACYAVALGRWESEAYWANFWYQGEKSRRELLIESLMGRTNREIREIKAGFSDKKYSDSLTKCMKTELKEDKFKKAVLLVLEEKKMEEGRHGVDRRLVEDDVHDLHDAVRSEKGGETKMIGIVVVRSDNHLREVLRGYESLYRANFAREMLKKSGNLVVCSFFPPPPFPIPFPPPFFPQNIY